MSGWPDPSSGPETQATRFCDGAAPEHGRILWAGTGAAPGDVQRNRRRWLLRQAAERKEAHPVFGYFRMSQKEFHFYLAIFTVVEYSWQS